jgi:hypothetical protein
MCVHNYTVYEHSAFCIVFIDNYVCLGCDDVNLSAREETAQANVKTAYKQFQMQFKRTKDVHKNNHVPMSAEIVQRHTEEMLSDSTDKLLQTEKHLKAAKSKRATLEVQLANVNLTGPPPF